LGVVRIKFSWFFQLEVTSRRSRHSFQSALEAWWNSSKPQKICPTPIS
jgi:hypothetical protein